MTEDRIKGPVLCDTVISHIVEEVIINDKLDEELRVVIMGAGNGRWRLIEHLPETIRFSEKLR